jgi:hypothetical protein
LIIFNKFLKNEKRYASEVEKTADGIRLIPVNAAEMPQEFCKQGQERLF